MNLKQPIHDFIDNSLNELRKSDLMRLPHPNMPQEMVDETTAQTSDWIPWKPIPSTVSENDIQEIESKIHLKLPESYKIFLKYKHFYDLDNPKEINFYRHCVRDWKKHLFVQYFDSYLPEEIIGKGYIPFATYSDWGIVCFNTSKRKPDGEYEIVMFDHELLFDDPVPKKHLYESFYDMLLDLRKAQGEPKG